jgi:ATP/maltotriose-dependent transcriptional regulator MalT
VVIIPFPGLRLYSQGSGERHRTASPTAELRILKLLPTSTYLQIAATLFVSRNTVKAHLRSVYQELGVASRSEAIERAVDLRLL